MGKKETLSGRTWVEEGFGPWGVRGGRDEGVKISSECKIRKGRGELRKRLKVRRIS
jgi:hypothetical protein